MTQNRKGKLQGVELEPQVVDFIDSEIDRVRDLTGYSPTITAVLRKILNAGMKALTENKHA